MKGGELKPEDYVINYAIDFEKWIKIMKEQPMQIINKSENTTLKEFITKFVRPNSLIRLWYEVEGGHQTVFPDNDLVEMEWSIVKGDGIYKGLESSFVKGVTDIVVSGNYPEAINIVIDKNK